MILTTGTHEFAILSIAHSDLILCLLGQHGLQVVRIRLQNAFNKLESLSELLVFNVELSVLSFFVV